MGQRALVCLPKKYCEHIYFAQYRSYLNQSNKCCPNTLLRNYDRGKYVHDTVALASLNSGNSVVGRGFLLEEYAYNGFVFVNNQSIISSYE